MARRRIKITRKVRVRVQQRVRVRRQVSWQPRGTRGAAQGSASSPARRPAAIPARATSSTTTPRLGTGPSPVAQVRQNLAEVIGDEVRDYDVFVSHASPDKDDVVRPLVSLLRKGGLEVWYDEFALRVGDSLRRRIDEGIRSARFGIVVLSPAFLKGRPWTEHELDGLVNGYIYNRQVLLPIWHDVDGEQVAEYSPSLADKVALSTADYSLEQIAHEIVVQVTGRADGSTA